MVVQGLGFGFYRRDISTFFYRTPVCIDGYRLFYKMGESYTFEEHDTQGGDQFCDGNIVQWFGIPQSLTTDQGVSFMSHQFKDFASSLHIKLLNSSPYYAQANG
jgi:hypothetical protein